MSCLHLVISNGKMPTLQGSQRSAKRFLSPSLAILVWSDSVILVGLLIITTPSCVTNLYAMLLGDTFLSPMHDLTCHIALSNPCVAPSLSADFVNLHQDSPSKGFGGPYFVPTPQSLHAHLTYVSHPQNLVLGINNIHLNSTLLLILILVLRNSSLTQQFDNEIPTK